MVLNVVLKGQGFLNKDFFETVKSSSHLHSGLFTQKPMKHLKQKHHIFSLCQEVKTIKPLNYNKNLRPISLT